MGCPQSKSKSKNISDDEIGSEHGRKVRNDHVKPTSEETKGAKSAVDEHTNSDDQVHNGRVPEPTAEPNDDKISPVFDTEEIAKNKTTVIATEPPESKTTQESKTFTEPNETTQNGLTSVYQADDEPGVPEYDRFRELDRSLKEVVDIGDVDVGQGVSEIEVKQDTITVDGEESDNRLNEQSESRNEGHVGGVENAGVQLQGGHIDARQSLKDQPNIRYQNKDTMEAGVPKDAPKPAPPKTKKNELINATTFTIADKIVDQAPDESFQSVTKLARYLSGEVKASDVINSTDTNEDPIGDKNMPFPNPTKRKKKDIFTDVSRFKAIDENAKNTPESVRLSVQKLASHLCKPASSDMDKVRAFYYWICNNIRRGERYMYDADNYSDRLRTDAVSTLRQGKGSFVSLMAALCNEAKIPVVTIPGCSKGLRHQPDKEFHMAERNHAWNAVHIDGEWRFVDCTWGSGFVASDAKFKQQFDEFWFLTDPEIFVYDHFPTHPIWQLLEEPIDIDEFNHKPSLTEKSREMGLRLISHREPIIYFENEVTVTFGTETIPLANITADLRWDTEIDANKHRCIRRSDGRTFSVRVVPPKPGEYTLVLYGKSKDYLHAKFKKLTEYTLRCESVYDDQVVFPTHYKAWGPEPSYSELGFSNSIQELSVLECDSSEQVVALEQTKNTSVTVEFRSVQDVDKQIDDFALITSSDSHKFVHLRFPGKGYYKLDVYAESKLEKYEFAAAFLLYCSVDGTPKQFPKYNAESVTKFRCRLIEPMDRELPADTEIEFRVESRDLKKAMLGIPVEGGAGQGLKSRGELKKDGQIYSAKLKTPGKGETLYLAGCSSPPNIFWSRMYEFVTI